MPEPKSTITFAILDPGIKKWIQSDAVFEVVIDLNKQAGCFGEEVSVIPQLIISIALGEVRPEDVPLHLASNLPFLEDTMIEKIAETLKRRVFKIISAPLKRLYGIDTEKISTEAPQIGPQPPVARVTKLDQPLTAPRAETKPAAPASAAPAQPSARTMQMTDVKRPPEAAKPASKTIKPKKEEGIEPDVIPTPKPFGLTEVEPKAPEPVKPPEPPKPPAPPAAKPAEHHELTEYHDEHPMKPIDNSRPTDTA